MEDRDIYDVSCEWLKNNTDVWINWLPQEQYQDPNVGVEEEEEFSVVQLVCIMIATSIIFIMCTFYCARKMGQLDCLSDILEHLWLSVFRHLLKSTNDFVDYGSDILAMFYLNQQSHLPTWYISAYLKFSIFTVGSNFKFLKNVLFNVVSYERPFLKFSKQDKYPSFASEH